MSDALLVRRLRRASSVLVAGAPVVAATTAMLAHERFTATHGTGFVGYELVDGPVYRTGTLILVAAQLLLLLALSVWCLRLRASLSEVAPVRRLIVAATALTLVAAVTVTVTTRSGRPVDIAFMGVGAFVLFGAACFQLGRSVRRSRSLPPHVGRLLQGVPVAVVVVIVSRGTTLERPALLLFGVLCASVALLVPPPLRRAAGGVRPSGTSH